MRKTITGMLAVGTLIATGCGGGTTFANKPRPPTPINLTVYVNNARVSSPRPRWRRTGGLHRHQPGQPRESVERPPRRRVGRPTGRRHRPDQPPGDRPGDRRPEQAGHLHADAAANGSTDASPGAADDPAGDAAHRSAATELEQRTCCSRNGSRRAGVRHAGGPAPTPWPPQLGPRRNSPSGRSRPTPRPPRHLQAKRGPSLRLHNHSLRAILACVQVTTGK